MKIDRPYFCNRCHRRIEIPEWLKNANFKVSGAVVINCGNCKKGKVKINGS
jgi:uncharacterized CHY-type Zn-finger protein